MVGECSKMSYRDVYNNLWSCRNFEIEHIWHRAIFLSAFLLATYAGYGGLLVNVATAEKHWLSCQVLNGIAFFLSLVGLLFSVLWIMMAKGSKAWYEHYENAIEAYIEYMKRMNAFDGNAGEITESNVHHLPYFDTPKTDCCILTTEGGTYSVSKINIAIGHFSLLIWAILLLVHFVIAIALWSPCGSFVALLTLMTNPVAMGLELAICIVLFCMYAKRSIRSSFLTNA
jgi:hypothetical protein